MSTPIIVELDDAQGPTREDILANTCDWGDDNAPDGVCTEPIDAWRFDEYGHGYLPVCVKHRTEG